MNNKFKNIKLFIAVVEIKNITSAAKHLRISKAAASRSISQLEELWDAQLLNRSTRSISLTEAGKIVYHHCKFVMCDVLHTADKIDVLQKKISGIINITSPDGFSNLVLADHIKDFLQLYPDVKLNINISGKRCDIISEKFDLAIRIGVPQSSNLKMKKILTTHANLYCATNSFTDKVFDKLSELSDVDCLLYSELSNLKKWKMLNKSTDIVEEVTVNGCIQADSDSFLINMALQGLGVLFCPEILVEEYVANGQLRQVFESYTYPIDIFILHNFNTQVPQKHRQFIDYLVHVFSKEKHLVNMTS